MAAAVRKGCELCCSKVAWMVCDSDQASLCWECDKTVHAANFLAAKHIRTLLCYICHSPTLWKATGEKLGPTVSVCWTCAETRRGGGGAAASTSSEAVAAAEVEETSEDDDGCDSAESKTDSGEYYSVSGGGHEEEDGENQVVPWSGTPPACLSQNGENFSRSSSKRTRDSSFESQDEEGCCSSHQHSDSGEFTRRMRIRTMSNDSLIATPQESSGGSPGTAAIVDKLQRFHGAGEEDGESEASVVLNLRKVT
ncbi:zinc finger protein CONSTANS-LIKE 4-like [Andrographis paniculata]|uniref:zinc finger protein CONSTANS-LIKE 4-like n=1 Tax=Andrographis paniculata TaxID=175694 RepID=UPI0021E8AE8B|nr:zinc finger protein CONSTANS-LIKE 4-like [Andrographis paniculata]